MKAIFLLRWLKQEQAPAWAARFFCPGRAAELHAQRVCDFFAWAQGRVTNRIRWAIFLLGGANTGGTRECDAIFLLSSLPADLAGGGRRYFFAQLSPRESYGQAANAIFLTSCLPARSANSTGW